ncbi:pyridoxal phosphate-dependent class II aminotransferase [Fertoebacter nigrum]|uniref:Aminotransferase n=1 Tax=Fertoeibacter niger TaxID=2656921 RepID=A0A8X8KPZ8_9RHOB|nr:threonine-phosphate decarboxylase [Fertoeibacter niger]NUB46640.1 pyridoxal phosphate-dependent class II aminotransferase [Fertoeibacter niger]
MPYHHDAPDHGGDIDAAVARFGGVREGWIDLSTGINPQPYPLPDFAPDVWAALPDRAAEMALQTAARRFWRVPEGAGVLAAPGASALIAQLPHLVPPGRVAIPGPTYNEHGRAFAAAGWRLGAGDALVLVNPNNPDGRVWAVAEAEAPFCIIDESFCDVGPDASLISLAARPGTVVLKSFGKFWGLAGLRLGFAIGDPALLAGLAARLGPWPVSGPALVVGALALADEGWAAATRARLDVDAARLDALVPAALVGGTPLFRLYDTPDAARWQAALARHHVWSRVFPYSARWLRLGLPGTGQWDRVAAALREVNA